MEIKWNDCRFFLSYTTDLSLPTVDELLIGFACEKKMLKLDIFTRAFVQTQRIPLKNVRKWIFMKKKKNADK